MKIIEMASHLRRSMGSPTDETNSKEIVRISTALPTNLCAVPLSAHVPRCNRLERCRFADEKQYELVH
jgi:hypothetical protein